MLTPTALRSRILHIFEQSHGGTNSTNAFDKLPTNVQSELKPYLIEMDELPIVASYISSDSWVMVTSNRLLLNCHGQHAALPWSEITACSPSDFVAVRTDVPVPPSPQQFKIETQSGQAFSIETEPGSPFMSFWNVLLAMIRR